MEFINTDLILTKLQSVGHIVELDLANYYIDTEEHYDFPRKKYEVSNIRDLIFRGDGISKLVINAGPRLNQIRPLLELITDARSAQATFRRKFEVVLNIDFSLKSLIDSTKEFLLAVLLVNSFDLINSKHDGQSYTTKEVSNAYCEKGCSSYYIAEHKYQQ